jgi:aminopeptidase N
MANVETPSVKGGMETSSAIFYGEELVDGKRSTRLRNIVIHELAHQWFGNSVTESSWDDAWLSEGFATYFTMLFIGEAYGSQEMTSQLQSAKKIIYTYFEKDPSYKIIDDRSAEAGPVTNAITYQKGAWVLHMLRNLMGEKSFQEGIRNYYSAFMNGNATTADFRKAMERAYGKDLKVFFDQWLYQGGNIVMNGSWKYDAARKKVTLLLQQTQHEEFKFDFSLEVGVLTGGKESPEISVHRIASRQMEITFHSDSKPEKVILDPRTVLLFSGDIKEIQ